MASGNSTDYTFSDRLRGDISLSVFDKYYLQVKSAKLKRDFKMELAMLSPEPVHQNNNALHWFAAMLLATGATGYLLYTVVTGGDGNPMFTQAASGVAAVLAGIFYYLFRKGQEHKWVFKTRSSLYPLIEVPYQKKESDKAHQFVKMLQATIEVNVRNKGYSNENLFAGEMRLLRRLAKHEVISDKTYDKIKTKMLKDHRLISRLES